MSAKDMMKQVEAIAGLVEQRANALLAEDRYKEAKSVITDGQRDLRDLKRAAVDIQRQIRLQGTDARQSTNKSGQMIGLVAGSKARGNMARGRAVQKRRIADKQADALRPYDAVKSTIDNVLSQMDRVKAQVTSEEQAARASGVSGSAAKAQAPGAAPMPPPPPTPATWAPDPHGRHELRYWDGTAWSHHVSNQGIVATDPPG